MKKVSITIIIIIAIMAGYYLISPFFINKTVNESLPTSESTSQPTGEATKEESVQITKQGQFTGFDKIHTGSGTASVIWIDGKSYIRFEEDFMVNNGPDLYVGLGKDGKYIKGSELGLLKGNIGSQNYELPAGVDPEEVWVWCKAFAVPFARAVLE